VSNLYGLLGPAGCGKSYTIKQKEGLLLTASTGIAALNLGGNIRTINSVLGFYDTADLQLQIDKGNILKNLFKISTMYKGVGIDEISMNPGKQVDKISYCFLLHNKTIEENKKLAKKHNLLDLFMLGDIAQLGPPKEEHDPFHKAATWKYVDVTYLSEIKRQNDPEFINAVSHLRFGRVRNVIDWFESKVEFTKKLDMDFKGSTCFPTNKQVDDYNEVQMAKLKTKEYRYYSEVSGVPSRDWKNIPEELIVKPGMKVMILANNFEERYANGDLGIIIECFPKGVLVELSRDGRQVLVNYRNLENTIISTKKNGEPYQRRIGSIEYLPIRQGYSSTLHKLQGLTLSDLQLDVTHRFFSRLSGGLYTGVTRVTDYKGLRIVGSKDDFIRACYINPLYLDYLIKLDSESQPQLMAA
jgi:ATP-dependent DNA helicase PIF1